MKRGQSLLRIKNILLNIRSFKNSDSVRPLVCIALLTGIIISEGLAQHTIQGKVEMSIDMNAVVGATVIINELGIGTVTDKEGFFRFEDIDEGSYVLEVSSVGLNTRQLTVEVSGVQEVLTVLMEERAFALPEIVVESVTMTGGLAGVQRTLGSAHYIGQKEIQKFSYTDITRTLRNIPGVNIQEEDGYGLRPNIGLRATGSERSSKITVMEDGVLAAPAPYAAPAAYYFPTVGRMEAIELMKGSSQIKYGPFTTGGAINLISTPIPTEFSGHGDLIYGSDNYLMLHANLGNAHKNFAYVAETMQYRSDGFKELDNGGETGFHKQDYMAKFRVNTNPDATIYQSLTFKVGLAREKSNETYLGLTDEDFKSNPLRRYAGSAEDVMNTEHEQYTLTHYAALTDFLDLYTVAYHNDFHRNWYKLDKIGSQSISKVLTDPTAHADELSVVRGEVDSQGGLWLKANNRDYVSEGIQTNAIFHFNDRKVSHKVDIGLRLHKDELDRFQWVDEYGISGMNMNLVNSGEPGTESNRLESAHAFSAYVQYRLKWNQLTVTPGLRYEDITMSRIDYGKEDPARQGTDIRERQNEVSILIPGMAISYDVDEFSMVFAGAHKGFAPPGSREGTNPEESWNFEMGYRFQKNGFRTQILGYLNNYENLLGADLAAAGGSGSQDLFNGGEAMAKGIEFEASYDILHQQNRSFAVPIALSYTFTESTFDKAFESDFDAWGQVEAGDFVPYVPRHQLSGTVSLEHRKVLVDLSGRYSSAMLTQAGTFGDKHIQTTDNAFTMDFAVNYRLTEEVSAFVNVNNLTNNVYVVSRRPAGVRPNLPRIFNVGLKANF